MQSAVKRYKSKSDIMSCFCQRSVRNKHPQADVKDLPTGGKFTPALWESTEWSECLSPAPGERRLPQIWGPNSTKLNLGVGVIPGQLSLFCGPWRSTRPSGREVGCKDVSRSPIPKLTQWASIWKQFQVTRTTTLLAAPGSSSTVTWPLYGHTGFLWASVGVGRLSNSFPYQRNPDNKG